MKENTCCFFGHRKIEDSLELRTKLYDILKRLIEEENICTFLFGSKSEFNALCLEIVSELKKIHPHINSNKYILILKLQTICHIME